jgi:phenylpropionate dioxygenase-like ring-hydroxylating dioxygenase large terminal subunit
MIEADSSFLRNLWYLALPSKTLKPGKLLAKTLLGEPILFGRRATGEAFAMRDLCPHRAIPLSCGRFDGVEVECCYHGWRFDAAGSCTHIPSLVTGQQLNLDRFGVKSYAVAEAQGNLWIFMGDRTLADPNEIAIVSGFEGRSPQFHLKMIYPCAQDHAVVGLMDPAHSPFVHRAWWWRSGHDFHEEAREFVASHLGFTMVRHQVGIMTFVYRMLGGVPETEISFRLPSVRIESTTTARYHVSNLTTITPLTESESEVNFFAYWNVPWLGLVAPFLRPLAWQFLKQDRDVVEQQQVGLKFDPSLMLIPDSDQLAKLYFQLKKEYAQAQAEGRDFVNPVKDRVLKWRA